MISASFFVLASLPMMMAFTIKPQSTSQVLFGCNVTKYEGVYYLKDNLVGEHLAYPMDGFEKFENCVEKCLITANCKAINSVLDHGCEILSSGGENADELVENENYVQITDSDHAFISCPEPVASGPVGCGRQAEVYQPVVPAIVRIIGGGEAKASSWPWQVYLRTDLGVLGVGMCGASLVRSDNDKEESDILITAAHCVMVWDEDEKKPVQLKANKISAVAGNHHLEKYDVGEQIRIAAEIVVHPNFQYFAGRNDIAIVKLAKPIKFTDTIRPICLPEQGAAIPVGRTCVASGWGRVNSTTGDTSQVLKQLVVPVHTAADCKKNELGGWGSTYVESEMICGGWMKAESGACKGDSGGMLVCRQTGGGWMLYGAASFVPKTDGETCLKPGTPAVFARVSNYVDWIHENIAELSAE